MATTVKLSLAQRRERWCGQVWDLIRAERYAEAVKMMTECRNFGRSRGWINSCAWFEGEDHELAERENGYARWLAIQSMIWFGREC